MCKHIPAQCGTEAIGSFGGKILRSQGTGESEKHQDAAHLQNIGLIPILDSHINHGGHNQRNNQFKTDLQQFKKGTQQTFHLIVTQIGE